MTLSVWGERPPRTAAHSIQIYVSALRKDVYDRPLLEPGFARSSPAAW